MSLIHARTEALFNKVYDVLVKHAGASETMRENCIHMLLAWDARDAYGSWEFRFMGKLGMGGRLWLTPESFHVSGYNEDLLGKNAWRKGVIDATNVELKKLFIAPEVCPACAAEAENGIPRPFHVCKTSTR